MSGSKFNEWYGLAESMNKKDMSEHAFRHAIELLENMMGWATKRDDFFTLGDGIVHLKQHLEPTEVENG